MYKLINVYEPGEDPTPIKSNCYMTIEDAAKYFRVAAHSISYLWDRHYAMNYIYQQNQDTDNESDDKIDIKTYLDLLKKVVTGNNNKDPLVDDDLNNDLELLTADMRAHAEDEDAADYDIASLVLEIIDMMYNDIGSDKLDIRDGLGIADIGDEFIITAILNYFMDAFFDDSIKSAKGYSENEMHGFTTMIGNYDPVAFISIKNDPNSPLYISLNTATLNIILNTYLASMSALVNLSKFKDKWDDDNSGWVNWNPDDEFNTILHNFSFLTFCMNELHASYENPDPDIEKKLNDISTMLIYLNGQMYRDDTEFHEIGGSYPMWKEPNPDVKLLYMILITYFDTFNNESKYIMDRVHEQVDVDLGKIPYQFADIVTTFADSIVKDKGHVSYLSNYDFFRIMRIIAEYYVNSLVSDNDDEENETLRVYFALLDAIDDWKNSGLFDDLNLWECDYPDSKFVDIVTTDLEERFNKKEETE